MYGDSTSNARATARQTTEGALMRKHGEPTMEQANARRTNVGHSYQHSTTE